MSEKETILMVVSDFLYSLSQGIFLPLFVYTLVKKLGLRSIGIFYSLFNMFIGFSIGISFYINRKIPEKWIIMVATLLLFPVNLISLLSKSEILLTIMVILIGFLYGIQISPNSEIAIKISEKCLYFSLLSYYTGMGLGGFLFYKFMGFFVEDILRSSFTISSMILLSLPLFYAATRRL